MPALPSSDREIQVGELCVGVHGVPLARGLGLGSPGRKAFIWSSGCVSEAWQTRRLESGVGHALPGLLQSLTMTWASFPRADWGRKRNHHHFLGSSLAEKTGSGGVDALYEHQPF